MLVLAFVLISSLLFSIFWIFPRKIKLMNKIGPETTNDHVIALAKKGNSEAAELLKISRINYWILIASGVGLVVMNHFYRK
jgi:hypothetical protein